jgi:hypothetical protein
MEFTEKEAFRIGFLKRAAERGYTPDEALGMIKNAGVAGDLLNMSWPAALALGIGVPVLGGAVTGSAHASLEDVSEDDIKRLKKRQLIQTLSGGTREILSKLQHNQHRLAEPVAAV